MTTRPIVHVPVASPLIRVEVRRRHPGARLEPSDAHTGTALHHPS